MNGKDIFLGLKYVGDDLIEKAEYGKFPEKTETTNRTGNTKKSIRRPILIAAIVALTALLVGCAVVYALRLQDMSIGKETYTQYFDESGKAIEPTQKERDIITIYGHSGDPIHQAMTEWHAFLETYDVNGELMDNDPDHEDIPNQYEWTYGCYTLDMAAKVDEIAAKYNLKLLEEWIPFQRYQSDIFFEETGIGTFLLPESNAKISSTAGMLYPPYNYDMDFELSVEGLDGKLWVNAIYARKDYLPNAEPGGMDLSQFEQWDYIAADGTALLLALSSNGRGYIIAETDNAMVIYYVEGNFSGSAYPEADEVMTGKQLEAVADVFDYSIQPQAVNREVVEEKLAEAQAEYDARNNYVPETYGSFTDILKSQYLTPDGDSQYAFYDLTGDGVDELLKDYTGDGAIDEWLTMVDGEVRQLWGNGTYLCEGHVVERYLPDPEWEDYAHHYYLEADSENAWFDLDPETDGDWIGVLLLTDGQWSYAPELHSPEEKEITEAEAMEYMAKYPHIQLDWKPMMEYPISENQTLGEYIEEKDVRVSDEELLVIYKDYMKDLEEKGYMHYSHYRILDINGDGVDDLLLKGENDSFIGNTDFYWIALTYRYGIIEGFAWDFYLCEDGVIEHTETRHAGGFGVEVDGHQFLRCDGFEQEQLAFAAYNKATASWQGDWWNEIPMTEAEANAILEKYPRIDQGMRPISELLDP